MADKIVFKNRLKLSKLYEFLSSSGNEFQTVWPAWWKAWQPYVLWLISWCRLASNLLSLQVLSLVCFYGDDDCDVVVVTDRNRRRQGAHRWVSVRRDSSEADNREAAVCKAAWPCRPRAQTHDLRHGWIASTVSHVAAVAAGGGVYYTVGVACSSVTDNFHYSLQTSFRAQHVHRDRKKTAPLNMSK